MSSSSSSSSVFLALCISLFCLASHANGFNVTTILSQFPEFSSFSSYLTQTQLAGDINGRQTITVLAVENGNLGAIDGQPADFIKKILSIHVVLDYFDTAKLLTLSNTSSMFTTLYQTSGLARNGEGFVNCTLENKQVTFGSGVPGSPMNSRLVKTVATQPYNISVLQVSSLIVPAGGSSGGSNSSSNNSTAPAPAIAPNSPPAPSNSPSKPPASPPKVAPAPSNSSSKPPASAPKVPPTPSNSSSKAPAPSKGGDAPTPSATSSPTSDAAPTADAPTADAPTADAPKASPPPSADSPDADAPSSDDGSGATAINAGVGVSLLVMGALSYALRAMA